MLKKYLRTFVRNVAGPLMEKSVVAYYSWIPSSQSFDAENTSGLTQISPDKVGPIDVVYTWVDDQDLAWLQKKNKYLQQHSSIDNRSVISGHSTRYHNRDELLYSLRSVAKYAGFVRNIYLVTDGQVPAWLNTEHPRIQVVFHEEIFTDADALPTFNSHAIESQLHHIKGLSEHYLYFNDDVFLGRPVSPDDFFTHSRKAIAYFSGQKRSGGSPREGDSVLTWAANNNHKLLSEIAPLDCLHKLLDVSSGQKLLHAPRSQEFLHIPHSQVKSILAKMEAKFPDAFQITARNRFRNVTDIIPTLLHHYYAAMTGRAELRKSAEQQFPNQFINVASPFLRPILKKILLTRSYKAFCINEPISADIDTSQFDAMVQDFLQTYFPDKCEFEK